MSVCSRHRCKLEEEWEGYKASPATQISFHRHIQVTQDTAHTRHERFQSVHIMQF